MDADTRFAELNLTLPPAPKPVGVYKPIVTVGNLAYLSGHGPLRPDKSLITGKVGADLTLEQAKDAARVAALHDGQGPGVLVRLELGDEHILARLTRRSAQALGLEPGVAVHAILKSVAVAQADVGDAPSPG